MAWSVLALVPTSEAQTSGIEVVDEGCKLVVDGWDKVRVSGGCDGFHRHGHWVINYVTGEKAEEGDYVQGRIAGIWRMWYKSGGLFSESTYADKGSITPLFVRQYYDYKNTVRSEITYDPDGTWKVWVTWDTFGRRYEQIHR